MFFSSERFILAHKLVVCRGFSGDFLCNLSIADCQSKCLLFIIYGNDKNICCNVLFFQIKSVWLKKTLTGGETEEIMSVSQIWTKCLHCDTSVDYIEWSGAFWINVNILRYYHWWRSKVKKKYSDDVENVDISTNVNKCNGLNQTIP